MAKRYSADGTTTWIPSLAVVICRPSSGKSGITPFTASFSQSRGIAKLVGHFLGLLVDQHLRFEDGVDVSGGAVVAVGQSDGTSADDEQVSDDSVSGTSPTKLVEQLLNSCPVEERPVCFVGHTDSKASGSTITPRLLKGSGEWSARYSWKAGLSPMNQLLFRLVSLAHAGAASPARVNRSSLDPARSASQRRSPVVEGLPKKIFRSAGRDTHLEFARCSRTIRKSSRWDHPFLRPWRMEAAASGTVTNRFTKIGLSDPAAIASIRRSRVTGPGTLSPLS